MEAFPAGQLCLADEDGQLLAVLTLNRINWDDDPASLQTWDDIAGLDGTYKDTYIPDGNTLCMMAMNIAPKGRGMNLSGLLVKQLLDLAERENIEHIIGAFRPNGYANAVIEAHHAVTPVRGLQREDDGRRARSDGSCVIWRSTRRGTII
ncbi:hypothetical protein ACQP1G_16585 [Nocardia sp. CA-107356]|uniref:hypothetical protein n=1 Tax=Nocardia sp. CA-107356 TaxID=3239972 RepID=UPI003D8FA601